MLIVLRTTIWVTFTNKLNLPPSLSGYAGDQFMESTLIPLAVTTTPTIEDCDLLCDANSACISFETSGSTCQLSSSCDHSMTTDSNGWNYYVRVQEGVVAPLEGNSFFGCLIMQQKSPPLNWHKLAQFNWLLRHTTLDIPMVVVLGWTNWVPWKHLWRAVLKQWRSFWLCFIWNKAVIYNLPAVIILWSLLHGCKWSNAWYLKSDGYTTHTTQGGKAYLWLINESVHSDSPSESPKHDSQCKSFCSY